METLSEQLTTLEQAGWEALRTSTGAEFYGRLMTADGLMVLADGSVLDRDQVVASLDEAPPWTAYSLSEIRCLDLADDTAALVYHADASRPGFDFTAVMTSCYVRRNGNWSLALHQQTVRP
jgi:hypothetical protein